jgi:hypothetical protein
LESTKEIWEKLVKNYEGDEKVKLVKLQTDKMKFEIRRMGEDENIASFFFRVVLTDICEHTSTMRESLVQSCLSNLSYLG